MRIIWVEDSQVLRHTLDLYTKKRHATVLHIADVDEFCRRVDEITDNDLVLLDILFDASGKRDKVGRGYAAIEKLIATGRTRTPVVILSVLDRDEVGPRVKSYRCVQAIIRKPVTAEELEEALDEAWRWRKGFSRGEHEPS